MPKLDIEAGQPILYYGCADLLAQIGDELANRPESCFAKNCTSWYNALYSATEEFSDCSYQVENLGNGEPTSPETLEDVIDIIGGFLQGKSRRIANASLRIICRQALRNITEGQAPNT